jgi:hypothetical protein
MIKKPFISALLAHFSDKISSPPWFGQMVDWFIAVSASFPDFAKSSCVTQRRLAPA